MNKWSVIKTWPTSPAVYVAGGLRYTEAATEEWVEAHPSAEIGYGSKIGYGSTIGYGSKIGYGSTIGDYSKIGNGSTIGDYSTIGDCSTIGNYSTIGNDSKIGDCSTIGDGSKHAVSPLYMWPHGGKWPVCVADPDKRLIAVGCEIHSADFWLNGGADKVLEKHGTEDTKAVYDAALRFVCEQMGWLAASEGAGT